MKKKNEKLESTGWMRQSAIAKIEKAVMWQQDVRRKKDLCKAMQTPQWRRVRISVEYLV